MAKQRNSLGMLVLPLIGEPMSFEDYKSKYGIDVSTLVYYDSNEDAYVPTCSKVIFISSVGAGRPRECEVLPTQRGIITLNEGEDDEHLGYSLFSAFHLGTSPDSYEGIVIDDVDKKVFPLGYVL